LRTTRHFLPTKVALAVGLSGLLAMPSHATLLVNSLSAASSASANGQAPATGSAGPDASYVSNYSYQNGTDGVSSADGNGWGNALGTYRAGSYGQGKYSSEGRFQRNVQITNDNGFATSYSLQFFIYYGSLYTDRDDYSVTGSGSASYNLSIKQGANTLFSSGALLNSDGQVYESGTVLDNAQLFANGLYNSYSWGGTYVTLNLGTLADGASTSINFDLVSTAFGNFDVLQSNGSEGNGYGYGYGCYGQEFETSAAFSFYGGGCTLTGRTGGGLGDPGDFQGNGGQPFSFVLTGRNANDIPLPGTLPLIGLGLAALGVARHRRMRSQGAQA
jgi:hypothetical protein